MVGRVGLGSFVLRLASFVSRLPSGVFSLPSRVFCLMSSANAFDDEEKNPCPMLTHFHGDFKCRGERNPDGWHPYPGKPGIRLGATNN